MATTKEKWQEIASRGLQDRFDPQTRAKFDEAVNRGLISLPDSQQGQPAPQPEVVSPQQLTPRRGVGSNPRNRRAVKIQQERDDTQSLLTQFEAGQITSQDLTDGEVERVRKARIAAIPEITGSFEKLSQNLGFTEALAGLTAFDPDEFGRILTAADPNIGVVTTPEGERIAINRKTDEAFSINKTGPTLMDAVQIGGSIAALTPASRATAIGTKVPALASQALASAGTQAAIETGQAIKGGEVNVAPIALAGGAGPVLAGVGKLAQAGITKLRGTLGISQPGTQTAKSLLPPQQAAQQADDVSAPLALEAADDVAPRKFSPLFGQESKNTTLIREALERGEGDTVAAGYVLDGAGKVSADPIARNVMKQGKQFDSFDPGKVSLFEGSSKADKKAFGKMLDVVEAGMTNVKKAALSRPGKVVGDSFLSRFKYVQSVNQQAGKDVGRAAKALKGTDVDLSPAKTGFLDSLEDSGVSVVKKNKLDFSGSDFEGVAGAEKLIGDLWKRLQTLDKSRDGLNIHRFKKFIDNQVDIGKRNTNKPITADSERIASNLRAKINKSLQDVSEEYKTANGIFSETIGPLKEFQRVSGRNFDPESVNANEFVGKLARRILSNAQSREPLIDSLHALEAVGRKHGGKFNDDIATQIMFVEQLEKTFGTFAATGLSGEVGKGLTKALRGDKSGLLIDAGGKLIDKARGLNEVNTMKALREFVKKGAK